MYTNMITVYLRNKLTILNFDIIIEKCDESKYT